MQEIMIPLADGTMVFRASHLDPARPTILFIHGLGESSLSFQEAFVDGRLPGVNVVAPDLLGYGRSTPASGEAYALDEQTGRLWQAIEKLGVDRFAIVGHSMGGDLGTLMASTDTRNRVVGLVNVEGDLTPGDIFISSKVVEADREHRFTEWFYRDFLESCVYAEWSKKWPSCRRYFASLWFCRPEAFRQNGLELFARNQQLPGRIECATGAMYRGLKIPTLFCWGEASLSSLTSEFLSTASLRHHGFRGAFHWPMIDQPDEFYLTVRTFVDELQW